MWWLRSITVGLRAAVALPLARPAAAQPAEYRVALVIGNDQYHYVPRATPTRDARLITETLKAMGFTLVEGQVQLDFEKTACNRMVQDFGNIIRSYSDPYILSPLSVAPVHTSAMVLLPEG
jgi:ABC-type sugar transport system substrate-binding protein